MLAAAVVMVAMWVALGPADPVFGGTHDKAVRFAASLLILIESAPAVGIAWLGAAGLGWPLRRWLLPDPPSALLSQLALGMAALLLSWWLLAWAGLLSPWTAWGLPVAGGIAAAIQLILATRESEPTASESRPRPPWELLLAAPAVGMLLAATTAPPGTLWRVEAYAYDVTSYHLQIPREWLAAGGMVPLRHNVYAFLPGLIESAYAHLGAMRGGVGHAIYAAQLFHASLALFAAAAAGGAVAQLTSARAGALAAAVLLSVPWTLVTGSLAYNEMATLAFGAAAVMLLLDIRSETWRAAAAIGFLLGAATLAKPTAGPMLAVPVGLVLLTRLNHAVRWRRPPELRKAVPAAVVAALVGFATLTPWLARNHAWTGNPVFPFATATLGTGHWDEALAERWDRGHGLSWSDDDRLDALDRQWLRNTGYGAVGGSETPRETRNIARFDLERGAPILWIAVALAGLLTVRQLRLRRAVGAMLLILAMQLTFWLVATHLQSRFLTPTILPAAVIIGLGYHRLLTGGERVARLSTLLLGAFVLLLASISLRTLAAQTRPIPTETGWLKAPLYAHVDTLDAVGRHLLDDLPPGAHAYLVADNMGLLYIDTRITYHTAFDANPLGEILRSTGGDPAAVTAALRERGITHLWAHWSELDRLHNTYGFDKDVTEATLRELAATWRTRYDTPTATLYDLR